MAGPFSNKDCNYENLLHALADYIKACWVTRLREENTGVIQFHWPRLPIFVRFGAAFASGSLFFLHPFLLLTGEVYLNNNIVDFQIAVRAFSFYFQSQYVANNYYRCRHSPWLVCPASACSQSAEWLPPSPYAAHSVALRRKWSCTSAIEEKTNFVQTPTHTSWFWGYALMRAYSVHWAVRPRRSWPVWVRFSTAAGCQESSPQCLQREKEPPPDPHCNPEHQHKWQTDIMLHWKVYILIMFSARCIISF